MNDQSPAAGRRRNFYQADSSLQHWLRRHAGAVVQRHTPRLTAFGDWVANEVDQAAIYTDRFAPPVLAGRPLTSDPQGNAALVTEVVHNPAYAEIHRDAYRHGMIGLAYSAEAAVSEPAPFLPGFVMGYLLAQADISIHCPVTLTGAVAYVLDRFAPQEIKSRYLPGLIRLDGQAATGGTWANRAPGRQRYRRQRNERRATERRQFRTTWPEMVLQQRGKRSGTRHGPAGRCACRQRGARPLSRATPA